MHTLRNVVFGAALILLPTIAHSNSPTSIAFTPGPYRLKFFNGPDLRNGAVYAACFKSDGSVSVVTPAVGATWTGQWRLVANTLTVFTVFRNDAGQKQVVGGALAAVSPFSFNGGVVSGDPITPQLYGTGTIRLDHDSKGIGCKAAPAVMPRVTALPPDILTLVP